MKKNYRNDEITMPRKVLCVALAAIFAGPALAEEDEEVLRLIKPESNISVGAGRVSADNQRFGVYNGLNKEGAVGLVDFSVIRREDETGTWVRAQGRNLGLSTRELSAEYEKQGDYRINIEFSQLPRVSPYQIRTDLQGIGTGSQSYPFYNTDPAFNTGAKAAYNGTVPNDPRISRDPSTVAPITLKTERQITRLGFNKVLSPTLEFKVSFQNDEKEGNRIFGRGYTNAQEFLAEPINSTTNQLDAVLNYTGEHLQLSGGYYGSFYENRYKSLNVFGGSGVVNGAQDPLKGAQNPPITAISLAPDNQAHQLHLSGAYDFTKTTRGSFKASRGVALQNDDFMQLPVGLTNISGRNDLGGKLDTTLVQMGINSRPIKGLTLTGSLRYEDRDDRTSIAQYISGQTPSGTPASSTTGYNEPRSLTTRSGKVEASYLLPEGFRLTGGLDIEEKQHSTTGVRVVGYRERTQENTYRFELARAMAETLTGSIAYIHSERDGSDYRNLQTLGGYAYPNYNNSNATTCATPITLNGVSISRCGLLQPIYIADRDRNKLRLALDWSPLDSLSTQFVVEDAKDEYGRGRGNPDVGVRKGDARLYSADLTYALTENWKLTGWASYSETSIDQATLMASPANQAFQWSAQQKNEVVSYSAGVRGKLLSARVDVGADYILAHDKTAYNLARLTGVGAISDLPDITYKQSTLKVFGKYAVNKDTTVRLDYIFDHRKTNDWTWNGWTYSDGTRIEQHPEDKVHFIAISANYSFR